MGYARGVEHGMYRHGYHGTRVWRIWAGMIRRCRYKSQINYMRYGGLGIKVCERWLTFENFLADLGQPTDAQSLDRIDSKGDYEPGNCRWATRIEQANNCKSNRFVEVDGVSKTIADWSRISGVSTRRIRDRLEKGWKPQMAVFQQPVKGANRPPLGAH